MLCIYLRTYSKGPNGADAAAQVSIHKQFKPGQEIVIWQIPYENFFSFHLLKKLLSNSRISQIWLPVDSKSPHI